MLPFTSRNPRPAEPSRSSGEFLRTDEIEVIRSGPVPALDASGSPRALAKTLPPPSGYMRSERPRPPMPSVSDQEMTRLLPVRKHRAAEPQPTFASTRRPGWSMQASPVTIDEPSRTLVRPSTVPPPASVRTIGATRVPKAPAVPREFRAAPPAPDSVPPVALSTTIQPASASGARLDPPGTSVTTRTRLPGGRPTAVWAAALVAMGVFVGLASAVLARGDGDSLVDATASFIDPAHAAGSPGAGSPAAAQAAAMVSPPVAALPTSTETPGFVPPVGPSHDKTTSTNDLPLAGTRPEGPPPVAYAAPARPTFVPPSSHRSRSAVTHPAPPPAQPEAQEAKDTTVKDTSVKDTKEFKLAFSSNPAPTSKARTRKHASDDDLESASAADALARAQLEAALR